LFFCDETEKGSEQYAMQTSTGIRNILIVQQCRKMALSWYMAAGF
jgi:hypothetical protein